MSQLQVPETCFQIRGGRKWTGLNNGRRLGPSWSAMTPKRLRRRAGHLWELLSCPTVSDRFHRYIFSDGHHRQCPKLLRNLSNATSSPAPKSHPHHPSIFILLLPRLIDFLFSLFSPSSPLSSSSLHLLKHTSYSSACLFSLFHSRTQSGQSFSSLTRSKPQPCSELLKVRKWRCNVIEWLGNRIYEGWV